MYPPAHSSCDNVAFLELPSRTTLHCSHCLDAQDSRELHPWRVALSCKELAPIEAKCANLDEHLIGSGHWNGHLLDLEDRWWARHSHHGSPHHLGRGGSHCGVVSLDQERSRVAAVRSQKQAGSAGLIVMGGRRAVDASEAFLLTHHSGRAGQAGLTLDWAHHRGRLACLCPASAVPWWRQKSPSRHPACMRRRMILPS